MKKVTYEKIANVLADIEFEGKADVLAELNVEINRGAAAKAIRVAEYDKAWEAVHEVLVKSAGALSVADIFDRCSDLPAGFKQGQIQWGLLNDWADRIIKVEGKPNTYRLK